MTRAIFFSLALSAGGLLAMLAYNFVQSLAAHAWLTALPLGVVLCAGIVLIAPGASAHPSPATAAEDALATEEGA